MCIWKLDENKSLDRDRFSLAAVGSRLDQVANILNEPDFLKSALSMFTWLSCSGPDASLLPADQPESLPR